MVSLLLAIQILIPQSKGALDESFLRVATSRCKFSKVQSKAPLLKALMQIERDEGVPEYARGITVVAACRESGFNPVPRRGDGGKAAGLFQWWPWWERRYGFDREREPLKGVRFTIRHVLKRIGHASRKCGKKKPFFYAYTWVMSGPKGWRCRRNRHVQTLVHWRWRSGRGAVEP